MRTRILTVVGALALAATLAGCDGDSLPSGPEIDGETAPAAGAGELQARLAAGAPADGEQTLTLTLAGTGGTFAAYQGELRFDASTFELREARAPDAEGFHVLNEGEPGAGRVRFAGYSARGFAGPVSLDLRVAGPRPVRDGAASVRLEVAGTAEGARIPPGRIALDEDLEGGTLR